MCFGLGISEFKNVWTIWKMYTKASVKWLIPYLSCRDKATCPPCRWKQTPCHYCGKWIRSKATFQLEMFSNTLWTDTVTTIFFSLLKVRVDRPRVSVSMSWPMGKDRLNTTKERSLPFGDWRCFLSHHMTLQEVPFFRKSQTFGCCFTTAQARVFLKLQSQCRTNKSLSD